jgi:hypothetical protein
VLQPPLLAPRSMNSSATGTQSAVAVGLSRPRRGSSSSRRQRRASSRSVVPRAAFGSKQQQEQVPPSATQEQPRRGMSTRALHHLEVYATEGRPRRTLEW